MPNHSRVVWLFLACLQTNRVFIATNSRGVEHVAKVVDTSSTEMLTYEAVVSWTPAEVNAMGVLPAVLVERELVAGCGLGVVVLPKLTSLASWVAGVDLRLWYCDGAGVSAAVLDVVVQLIEVSASERSH
jgi:hypothetical protein